MTSQIHSSNQRITSSNVVPVRKVAVGGIAGAFVTVVVLILNTYVLSEEKKVPAELSSAVTTLLTFAASYMVAPGPNEVSTRQDENMSA